MAVEYVDANTLRPNMDSPLPNSPRSHQGLMGGGILVAVVIVIFIALAYRKWGGKAKPTLLDRDIESDAEVSMNNKSAMIFGGAIALCALAYFATHIYIPCGVNNTRICNSVTGSSAYATE